MIATKNLLNFHHCKNMKEYIKVKNLIFAILKIAIKHLLRYN